MPTDADLRYATAEADRVRESRKPWPTDPFQVYFPESNRDEIIYHSGDIGLIGHCKACGCSVIRALWLTHAEWHRDIAEEV